VSQAGRRGYDIIVVGGGAAGCVVAARLAQDARRHVLLVEAGPDLRQNLPAELRDGWHITRNYDWAIKSEPDGDGNVRNLRRMRLLGGTSWLTRFAVRGSPADYAEWAALGNDGWDFDALLPWFRKIESDLEFADRPWHGADGPIPVTRYPHLQPSGVHAAAAAAMAAAGLPTVEDHNQPGAVGVGRMPMSSRDAIRTTTLSAYLPRGEEPANLAIRSDSLVSAVAFAGHRATGVRLADGTRLQSDVVVLSAGVYGSPAILLRSGVGPADELIQLGVPVTVDVPGVGENLADHPAFEIALDYHGDGRAVPVLQSMATFHSELSAPDDPPDLMFWFGDPMAYEGDVEFSLEVVLLKPRSRGRLSLRTTDPADPPRVDLRQLTETADLARLVEGYRLAHQVIERPELRSLCDGPKTAEIEDEAELHRLIRRDGYSIPHVAGTCAMGPRPAAGAVVDLRGRVHGLEGLFVVDASIMPNVPSGFTHLPTIMLAERLANQVEGSAWLNN
jgi:choline dehydrogenase